MATKLKSKTEQTGLRVSKIVESVMENYNANARNNALKYNSDGFYEIDWDAQYGWEISYQMRKFADRGYFDNKSEEQVLNFLECLFMVAQSGFNTAIRKIIKNVKF